MIITLLLTPMCNAMEVDATTLATHQELQKILDYDEVFDGFPFRDKPLYPHDRLQKAYNLLQHRQKSWNHVIQDNKPSYVIQAGDMPPVKNDITLWRQLYKTSRMCLGFYTRVWLEDEPDNIDKKLEAKKKLQEIFTKITILHAQACKGLSLELVRSIESPSEILEEILK